MNLPDAGFRFHHLGVAVADLEKSIPIYRDLFGYELIFGPFTDPNQKVVVCFLSRGAGDMVIELVMPSGPDSPVMRTLNQGGERLPRLLRSSRHGSGVEAPEDASLRCP